MAATIEDVLNRIKPEYRHTVQQAAWVFISEELKPSTISIPRDTVLAWFIDMSVDMLGEELVRDIGIHNLWAYAHFYLNNNIGYAMKNGRYHIAAIPVRYSQRRRHTKGNGMFDIERSLGARPGKLVKYNADDMNGSLN